MRQCSCSGQWQREGGRTRLSVYVYSINLDVQRDASHTTVVIKIKVGDTLTIQNTENFAHCAQTYLWSRRVGAPGMRVVKTRSDFVLIACTRTRTHTLTHPHKRADTHQLHRSFVLQRRLAWPLRHVLSALLGLAQGQCRRALGRRQRLVHGVAALASALRGGALPSCTYIGLSGNPGRCRRRKSVDAPMEEALASPERKAALARPSVGRAVGRAA